MPVLIAIIRTLAEMSTRSAVQRAREALLAPPKAPYGVTKEVPRIAELAISESSRPFLFDDDLPPHYTEREFTMSGVADYYDLARPGDWQLKRRKTAGFCTRLLVRAPSAELFNGIVVVDWLNVTLQFDLDTEWVTQSEAIAAAGCAYVGVTAQRYGTQNLVRWNPQRYGGMHIWDDGLSYEIFSQTARAVRSNADQLLGLDVQKVIGVGASQSAWRLTTYVNAFHPRDHAYDGYLLRGRGFGGTPLRGDGILNGPKPAPIRADIDVPVMIVQNEGDLLALQNIYDRQDDGPNLRIWEIPGSAHGSAQAGARMMARAQAMGVTIPALGGSNPEDMNCMRSDVVSAQAYRAIVRWVATGEAPPSAPRIELSRDPGRPVPVWRRLDDTLIARDAHGNAKGGIRLPDIEVPLARWYGATNENRLGGAAEPFSLDGVRSLYPTRDDYVSKVRTACEALVQAGFIDVDAANAFVREAEEGPVPEALPGWLAS